MNSTAARQAVWVTPPRLGVIRVITPTTSSQVVDITEFANSEYYITLCADGNPVYVIFNNTNSITVDETATTGNNRAWLIPAGAYFRIKLNKNFDGFMGVKLPAGATGTCTLRYTTSSQPDPMFSGTSP